MFSEGVVKGRISIDILSKILSENPAKIFKLFPKKGTLAPGSDADIVVLDPEKKWVMGAGKMQTAAGWTPYEGREITGAVETTIVRGKIVFREGEVIGEKGYGCFVRPLG